MAEISEVGLAAGIPNSGTGEVPTLVPVRDKLTQANDTLDLIEAVTTAVKDATANAFKTLLVDSAGAALAVDGTVTTKGDLPHGDPDTTPFPLGIGGTGNAAAPSNVTEGDRVGAWHLLNGAQAAVLTAGGALMPGDATNGLDIDVTRLPALVAGTALIGRVKPEGDEYETVAASATAQALGATGAAGDYLSHVWVQPTSTTVGVVTVLDNAIEVHAYPGGTVTAALYPFCIDVKAVSVSGAWKITTGAGVKCTAYGNFT